MENYRRKRKKAPHQLLKGKKRLPFKDLSSISSGTSNLRKRRKPKESSSNIVVSVRVRPIVSMESGSMNILKVCSNTISVMNPKNKEIKLFSFDRAYTYSNDHEYDQQNICGSIAKEILKNSSQGYNSCCFCYGQTGSGKTYTMMSSNASKPDGILPQVCRGLFQIINSANQNFVCDTEYKVSIGMVEIYNEKLRDLLNPDSTTPLTILDNGDVSNLEPHIVNSYPEALNIIERGNSFRNTAQTAMNSRSSRSHTIVQIRFIQTENSFTRNTVKRLVSKINLIDLAGSERTKKAKTSGLRQKEGISINSSLTHLGVCIRKLCEKQEEGNSQNAIHHVPFRNSKLTYLLKNSLVGNSKTHVIVNISPSSMSYEETKMSLDFASRMKLIRTEAKINEDLELKKRQEEMETKKIEEMKELMQSMENKYIEKIDTMKQEWADELNELEAAQEESFQISLDLLESEKEDLANELSTLRNENSDLQTEISRLRNLNQVQKPPDSY